MATTGAAQQPEDSTMEEFFKNVSAKDRTGVEKHLAVIDAEPDAAHGRIWRHLAKTLRRLAPLALQTAGQHAVQFFVADGKYRMQAFALEDQRDGKIQVYLPDVLEEAAKARVLRAPTKTASASASASASAAGSSAAGTAPAPEYVVAGAAGTRLRIEALDAANSPNPAPHYKHMLGWNRKALRITLLTTASDAEIEAAEKLCSLAAKRWAGAAAPAK
jgi:hypothetical protein